MAPGQTASSVARWFSRRGGDMSETGCRMQCFPAAPGHDRFHVWFPQPQPEHTAHGPAT